jgi:hypothetical protein
MGGEEERKAWKTRDKAEIEMALAPARLMPGAGCAILDCPSEVPRHAFPCQAVPRFVTVTNLSGDVSHYYLTYSTTIPVRIQRLAFVDNLEIAPLILTASTTSAYIP